jgi:hypothetical protein
MSQIAIFCVLSLVDDLQLSHGYVLLSGRLEHEKFAGLHAWSARPLSVTGSFGTRLSIGNWASAT